LTPRLVADVGNTRIKWGLCRGWRVVEMASLPPSEPEAWHEQLLRWNLSGGKTWAIAGVHPGRRDELAAWLRSLNHTVLVLQDWQQLPLQVTVDEPQGVGIDRLLNAVAFVHKSPREVPGILISAGTAVTVDCVDGTGAFRGGAIFPGLRLMGKVLHQETAKLPFVAVQQPTPPVPATNTPRAIEAGIYWATVGGIRLLVQHLAEQIPAHRYPDVYLTGGDAPLLAAGLEPTVHLWPEMTLEGIRLAAENPP
jgi:type III pantothenate kinase